MTSYNIHPDYLLSDRSAGRLSSALSGPTPCDGCDFYERCATQRLACRAFSRFLALPKDKTWQGGGRDGVPTAERYESIFASTDYRGGARRGLSPKTCDKLDALRALRGAFPSRSAVLDHVGLAGAIWKHIESRDPELAAHVLSLVRSERTPQVGGDTRRARVDPVCSTELEHHHGPATPREDRR